MSKQSGKKKRIGSRRHGVNHKNTNETDEFLVADSVPVAEHSVLEDKELAFAKPDDSQSQTAASPELTGNRRKLGSSRRHKGGRHVKESETESHHKPREEVEEKTEGEGSPETTQMSPVTQHEEGNFLSKNYEHEIVTHEGLLYFSEELPKVKESKGREESTEIIRLDGNPQSSYMSESNVESLAQPFSPTPDLTEQSECNIQQAELSAPNKELSTKEQQKEIFSLSAEVKDAWQSEKEMKITQLHGTDDENLMHERLPTERISENLNNQAEPSYTYQYKFESTGASAKQEVLNSADKQDEQHKKEDTFEGFVDKTEDYHVCDLVQLASVKANNGLDQVDEKESGLDDDMKPQVDQTFQEMEKNPSGADLNSSSLQMLQSETETYFDSHRQDTFVTRDEQDSDCSPVGNRRKLGSSRKHKIKQIKDSATESYHEPTHEVVENIAGKEGLETEVSLPIETAQRKSEERALAEMTFDTSQFEKLCCPVENQCLLDILDERSPQNQPENESIVEKETVPSSKQQSSTLEEQSEISTLSEIRGAHQSEEAVNTVLEPEFHLTQSQEILEIVHSEILTPNVVEHLEIFSGNPVKQDKVSDQSEFTMRSSDDSVAKQEVSNPVDTHDEHPTKVINIESFDHRKEEYERPRISDDKREDTALDQVFTTQGKVEDDINHTSDQTGYLEKEGLLNQVESKSFQTLPSEISLNSQHLQTNSSLILTAAEMYQGPNEEDNEMTKDNEPSETTKSSLTGETTAEDISIETNMVDSDTFDTVQMEEVGNQLKHDASFGKVVDASGLTSLNFVSEVDQKLVELSTKIPDEELHKITVTEKEHRDKENNFSKPHVNLPANSLVNEQRLNSEEQDSLLKMVVTTENHRPQSGTEFEWSIEHEEFSSQKEELPKNEKQNEVFSSCEAAGVLHSKDTANEVHRKGEEVKQAQVQEIHYPSERVTDDATESSASVSGHPNDQISDLCQPELNVESTDLVTMQDNPNPDGNVFSNQEKVLFEDEDSKSVKTQQSEMISNLEDSAMEYRESTRVREELETSQMQLETETVGQEELSQQTDYDVSIPVPHDGTSNLAITHSGLQNPTPANYPEKNLESPIPESENLQDHGVNEGELRVEECNESMLVPLEGMDTSGTFQVKDAIGPHFSEDAFHDQDVKPPPQMQEKHELDSAGQSVKQSPNISKEMVLSNLIEEAEVSDINQPELTIKSSFDRPSKQEDFPLYDRLEDHPAKSTISEAFEQANDDHHPGENVTETHEDEVKPTQMPEEDENIWSTVKEGDSSVQALQAEINVPSDSESQHMNPNGNPIRNRRKLGSSRRSKRQQHVENIVTETLHEPKEECVQKRSNDEAFDVKATEMSSSDLLSGHPKDQVSDLCQPELNVESTDLVTMQDNPNPDGNVFSNQEKVLFEDEDSKSVKTQQSEMISNLEDSAMEYRESTRVREELETSQMQLETETVGQEELSQQTDYDVSIPVPHDGTSNLAITHSGLQNPTPANYPEKNLESPIPESENLQDHGVNEGELRVEECNESMLVPLEGMDTSGTFQDEDTRGAYHSEDAFHDQDVTLPAQTQEKHELDSAGQSVKQSPNISKEMVLSNLIEEAEVSDINQPELTIKSSFDRPSKQEDFPLYDRLEDHPAKSTISEAFEQANDDHHPGENVTETHEDEVKPTQIPEEDENIWSTVKEGDSSVQALQAEINVPSDSESQHMNPNGNPIRNRRKLGSSRRSKRQQHVENIVTETLHEPKEECVQKRSNDEAFDVKATEMSSSDLLSCHPKDQVSDLCQPELNVESTDLVTMQDNPNPDGNVFSNQEKVLFEDEDSKSVKTQQSEMISNLEDSAIEYRESTRVREELETSQMQLGTETVGQEELSQQTDYDVSIPVPHDGTSNLAITHSGLQNPTPANYPEKNLESPIPESENLQDHGVNEGELRVEECNESMLVPLEGMDTSGTFQDEDTRGAYHSEDAFHDQDVTLPAQTQEKHELDSAGQSVKQSPNISKEMVLSNLIEEAEVSDINQPELTIKSSFDHPSKQEDFPLCDRHEEHTTKSTISEALEQANDDHHPGENVTETHEDEVKPTQMPEEDENIWSTVKEGDSSVQALQAEINVPSDSESQHMNPNGNPIRNRRKLGSSRRSKRQQHVENIVTETLHEPKEECVQKRSNDEAFDVKATEMSSSDLLSGHPKDQVSDLCQPELNVESTDLVTMQDNPNPDGNVFSNQEKVLFEDEDSKSVKTQQSEMISNLEDSAMEYRESTRVREELETSQMQLETETVGQEELSQQTDYDVSIPVPHDGTSNLAITHSGLQNPTPANYPEKNLESPIPESENLQDHGVNEGELRVEECNESMLVPLEGMDTSGTFQDEDTRGAYHSEDAFHDQDVTLPAQTQEKHELDSAGQSVKQSPNISKEMVLSNLIEEAEVSDINQPELTIKSSFDRPSKQEDFPLYDRLEDHPAKSTISEAFEQANDDHHPGENVTETHEDEVKPTQMPEEDENIWSTVKEGDSSVQALQAEINVPSDSESQHMNPNGNPIRNRRKLGSSRRSKRQQHVENIVTETLHEPKEECVQKRSNDEAFDVKATEMSSSDLLSGHPKDQVSDLCQPELNVESTDLVTMQDNPNPDGNVFSNQEKVLFEDEDSKSVKTQQSEMISNLEDSAIDYRESTRGREELETSQMQLGTETVGQEELSQQTDYDVSIPVPHDGTSNLAITHSGLQNPTPANYPEKNLESPIPESENLQDHGVNEGELRVEECNESMLVPLEGMDTSGTFQDEDTRGAYHSEDAFHDQDVTLPAQTQEKHELDSAGQSVKQSPNISKEMVLSNLIEEAEVSDINQPELTIKSSFDRPSKQEDFPLYDRLEDHPAKSTISEAFEQANDDHHPGENVTETHEDEVKPAQMPEEDENIWSTVKEGDSSVQALQAEINVPSDSESQHMNPNGNPIRNRRKLGSSRRSKRQQHVENIVTETLHESKEECVQKRSNDEALNIKATEISSAIDKKKEGEPEEDFKLNPPIKVRNDNGNTGLVLSQNVKDDNLGQKEGYNDLDNLSQLTELVQSPALKDYLDTENIPCHDDIDFIRPFSSDPFEQEDDYHIQNKEPSPYDKDKIIITQQTNDTVETVGHVMFDDYKTEADTEVDVPVSGNEEVENFKDLVKRDQDTENIMALREITASPQSGLFSTTHKTESLAPLDTNPVVNLKAEQAVDVAEENGSENLQEKSKQKKRKFGSNRRILFKGNLERVQESKDETKKREFDAEADLRSLEKMKVMEDIPRLVSAEVEKQLETQETISHLDLGQILQGSTCDPQSLENDIISDKNLATENSANSNMTGENSVPLDETTLCSQSTAERPESAIVLQHQALKSATELVVAGTDLEIVTTEVNKGGEEQNNTESSIQESNKVDEEVHNTNLEMKNASPNLTHRRRKMGSTRKNLKSKTKEDGLHQKQEIDNEATEATTNAEDVKTDYFSGNKEEDSEPKVEHGDDDSEQKKAIVLEQAEFSHISDSHLTPTALGTSEDNLEPNSKIEHQLTPDYLPAKQSTTPELDAMPEATSSGRRRKFGSNRKTRGQQSNKNQTVREEKIIETESGSDGEGVTDESAVKTNEKKTSEVENTKEEASPGISTLKGGDNSAPKSEKKSQQVTRVQQPSAGIHQSQEGQKTFSLVNSKEAVNRSNSYNVVMVGDSCVGKTAFMKRAVVGKFSTDLPASCGIDTCLGTVVVDGKVVMLQLWDTAGQERFQSITRQIFHRAQAFLLMYDITSSHSFSAVSYWASCIQDGAAEDVTVLLLGNKSDLTDRQVTFQEGETLAKEHNFYFMECSAATGENVIQSLESVARMLSQKADTREETTVLLKEPQKKKSSRCC